MASLGSLGSIGEDSSEPSRVTCSSPNQRPSYFDFSSTSGLYPPQHTFDEGVIKRLDPELFDDSGALENTLSVTADEEKLKTFLRIRPIVEVSSEQSVQIKDDTTVVAYSNPKLNVLLQGRGRKQMEFQFTKVLGPECGQSTVFEECITPIIEKFLKHENCLIFSYGATNSGKTYTMQGHGQEYGIIPRTLDSIFSRIHDRQYKIGNIQPCLYQSFMHLNQQEIERLHEKRDRIIQDANIKQELMNSYILKTSRYSDRSGSTVDLVGAGHMFDPNVMFTNSTLYSIWVSYAELYNERVYDLLDSTTIGKNRRRKELRLLQDRNGFVYIKDLTELPVTSDEEAYKLFLAGQKNLQFAATQMNQHSSRSHSFFTIRVVSIGIGEGAIPYPKTVHRMTFCDLAGMERANQTENKGFRLQESGNINNSLTVLLKVIRVLREKQAHNAMIETIPFRESKLTHIFKSYLTSSTHICMLVNVNPDPAMSVSTLQVLQNSAVASNVVVFRPMEVNVQAEPDCRDVKRLANKPPLPPNCEAKKKRPNGAVAEKRVLSATESDESDGDGYGAETVVAPKTMLQKLKILENENAILRARLAESEAEKNRIREDMMKLLQEERLNWINKLQQVRVSEDVYNRRRLSLASSKAQITNLSPGSKCGRCVPPTMDMEDIDETFEEEENDAEDNDKENHHH